MTPQPHTVFDLWFVLSDVSGHAGDDSGRTLPLFIAVALCCVRQRETDRPSWWALSGCVALRTPPVCCAFLGTLSGVFPPTPSSFPLSVSNKRVHADARADTDTQTETRTRCTPPR